MASGPEWETEVLRVTMVKQPPPPSLKTWCVQVSTLGLVDNVTSLHSQSTPKINIISLY